MKIFNIQYFISLILLSGTAKVTCSPLTGNSQMSSFFHQGQPNASIKDDGDAPALINPKEIMFNPYWSVPGGNYESWNFGLWANPFWNLDLDANDIFWAVNPPVDSQEVKGAGIPSNPGSQAIKSNHFRTVAPEITESNSDDSIQQDTQYPSTLSVPASPEYPAKFSKEDWAALFTLNQALSENPRLVYKLLAIVSSSNAPSSIPSSIPTQNQNTI
ncbi:hypothetical protein CONCODRAFT_5107 [Conidiobolus coronatus NRRL 28638]|uniref:Uncharacterized protein n=1 Tax=Conidiobolus coronatus (strain ATCC 28846 / CBS 209.66 / NRRL 28638) TaxID=796925 RepID=A0A137PAR7_CONC2|nr:hypothetical protein CONCODRAFT_5107 [Conidiobolus coronatus NRRL 28638]|eukprot:KXN72076.1 hypothetical protein CONCODRAFT_5107 [Conidiobolus coronatus NRRL 28638]